MSKLRFAEGITVLFRADTDKAKPPLKSNLIINILLERKISAKKGQAQTKLQRIPFGSLPELPFEIASR